MKNSRSEIYPEPMRALYSQLAAAGLAPEWVRKFALPDWWTDNEAHSATGAAMARGFIARHVGLDAAALGRGEVICAEDVTVRHEKHLGCSEGKTAWVSCLAVRAARLALKGAVPQMQPAKEGAMPTAATLRRALLRESPFVSLEGVLELCWDLGIPVLPITEFPTGTHKMDGLAVTFEGRSAIVLSKPHRIDGCRKQRHLLGSAIVLSKPHSYSAAMPFVLAHELGHILLGHCGDNGISLDKGLAWESAPDEAQCERLADAFAVELLTGDAEMRCVSDLKSIELDRNAVQIVREVCAARMRWDSLTEEAAFYLKRLCQLKSENEVRRSSPPASEAGL